jgi:hypothetical protein
MNSTKYLLASGKVKEMRRIQLVYRRCSSKPVFHDSSKIKQIQPKNLKHHQPGSGFLSGWY